MKPTLKLVSAYWGLGCLLLWPGTSLAASKTATAKYWYLSASASALYSDYSNSQWRDNMNTLGLRFDADYLDTWQLDLAYNRVSLTYTTEDELLQNEWFINAQRHFYLDPLAGRLSLFGGLAYLNNDQNDLLLSSGQDDSSQAYIYSVGSRYLSYNQAFYVNSQYSHSFYVNFEVVQWFNQLGTGLGNHWFSLANYRIESAQNTSAFEFAWKYAFQYSWLDSVYLSYLQGERLYAIEPEANVVLNLADKQTAGYKLGALLVVSESLSIELLAGYCDYEEQAFFASDTQNEPQSYSQISSYLNLKVKL